MKSFVLPEILPVTFPWVTCHIHSCPVLRWNKPESEHVQHRHLKWHVQRQIHGSLKVKFVVLFLFKHNLILITWKSKRYVISFVFIYSLRYVWDKKVKPTKICYFRFRFKNYFICSVHCNIKTEHSQNEDIIENAIIIEN